MTFRVFRPLLILAFLPALFAPASIEAQRARHPFLTPRQDIATSAFFGGMLGALGGGAAGVVVAQANCPEADRELFGCNRATVFPDAGFALGVGPGAYLSAAGAAIWEGCDPADARRRARRGALRGFVLGVAPLLAYHVAGGRDEVVEWSLALAGSGVQVASVTHATWGCLDAR